MKRYILKIFISLALTFGLCSCEKFFTVDLQDQATLEEVFSQSSTIHNYLMYLYSFLPCDEENQNLHGWVVPRSDEAQFSWYQWVYYLPYKTGNYGSSTPESTRYFDFWGDFYVGINQCSLFMEYADLDKEDSPAIVNYMKAEARFLRVFFYYCLFRQYGPVYIWGDQRSSESIVPDEADRHTVKQNIDFMVSELDKCIATLPMTVGEVGESEARYQGRITKGGAMALKSRILLWAASPLYNGCDLYKGKMKNLYGDYLFPQEADPNKWQIAADAAKDVIDLGIYSLCKSSATGDAFKDGAASYQKVYFDSWNSETILGWWRRTYYGYEWLGAVGGYLACCLPPNMFYQGYGGVGPSLKLVDSYPMWESGRYPVTGYYGTNDYSQPKVDALSGYKATGFTEGYHQPVDADWAPAIKAHNSCIGRDPRYYVSMVPNGFWWPNKATNKKFTCWNDEANCTSWWRASGDCQRVGYAWRKLYKADTPLGLATDYQALNYVFPAIRLAEIYLNYAEACNEKPERDEAEAIKYLNMVRNRVGLNNIEVAYPEIAGNKELLRWCIQKEKMVEFALDGQRHYDACRWMIAKDEYNVDNWTLHLTAKTYEESYERVNDDFAGDPSRFTDRDYLFPISAKRLSEMTNMTQNYGF